MIAQIDLEFVLCLNLEAIVSCFCDKIKLDIFSCYVYFCLFFMSAYYIAYMTAHTSQAEYNGTCGSSTERGENSPDALCKLQVSIT